MDNTAPGEVHAGIRSGQGWPVGAHLVQRARLDADGDGAHGAVVVEVSACRQRTWAGLLM